MERKLLLKKRFIYASKVSISLVFLLIIAITTVFTFIGGKIR